MVPNSESTQTAASSLCICYTTQTPKECIFMHTEHRTHVQFLGAKIM